MKTQTSKKQIWLRSLILLPLLAILLYSFSTKTIVEREYNSNIITNQSPTPILIVKQNPLILKLNGKQTDINNLKNDFANLTNNQPSNLQVNSLGKMLDYEVWETISIEINELLIETSFSHGIKISDNFKIIPKGNGSFNILKKRTQDGASKEDIAEYNKLVIYYNSQSKKELIIKENDLNRLRYLYNIMSVKQQKNAKPLPVIPPPPKVLEIVFKIEETRPPAPLTTKTSIPKKNVGKIAPPPPPIPKNATPQQKEKYKKIIDNYEKTTKKQVYQLKSEEGENINIVVNDCLEIPTKLDVNSAINILLINCIDEYPNNILKI